MGILWARKLERVAVPFSRESSQHRDQTQVSHTEEQSLPSEPPGRQVYSKCKSRKSYPDSSKIQVIQVQVYSEYTSRKAYPGDKSLHSKVTVKCCELIQEVT